MTGVFFTVGEFNSARVNDGWITTISVVSPHFIRDESTGAGLLQPKLAPLCLAKAQARFTGIARSHL